MSTEIDIPTNHNKSEIMFLEKSEQLLVPKEIIIDSIRIMGDATNKLKLEADHGDKRTVAFGFAIAAGLFEHPLSFVYTAEALRQAYLGHKAHKSAINLHNEFRSNLRLDDDKVVKMLENYSPMDVPRPVELNENRDLLVPAEVFSKVHFIGESVSENISNSSTLGNIRTGTLTVFTLGINFMATEMVLVGGGMSVLMGYSSRKQMGKAIDYFDAMLGLFTIEDKTLAEIYLE